MIPLVLGSLNILQSRQETVDTESVSVKHVADVARGLPCAKLASEQTKIAGSQLTRLELDELCTTGIFLRVFLGR
jgi:hypothetical protein